MVFEEVLRCANGIRNAEFSWYKLAIKIQFTVVEMPLKIRHRLCWFWGGFGVAGRPATEENCRVFSRVKRFEVGIAQGCAANAQRFGGKPMKVF